MTQRDSFFNTEEATIYSRKLILKNNFQSLRLIGINLYYFNYLFKFSVIYLLSYIAMYCITPHRIVSYRVILTFLHFILLHFTTNSIFFKYH